MMRFVVSPEITPALFDDLLDCWTEASNAGGSVGFVPPVTREDIRATADATFARCATEGPDRLLVGFDEDGAAACWLVLADNGSGLRAHWRTVIRVMVHPKHQGKGFGADLMHAADDAARRLGLQALHLTCRGGTGVDAFYTGLGYREAGRFPRSIRVAESDYRDEIYLVKFLNAA